METLGKLRPLEGGVVTAGNASQQNDAAAACLVVAEDKLDELGLEPIAWFHSWAAAGCDPSRMGIGPVPAVERSEEHTSELQSLMRQPYAVFCLKKKKQKKNIELLLFIELSIQITLLIKLKIVIITLRI